MKKVKKAVTVLILFAFLLQIVPVNAAVYSYFPDVSEEAEYANAVNALVEMGIISGDENGNFNPNNTITRAEFAAIMCRLLGVQNEVLSITKSSFTDVPSSHWACGYVTKAVELGLVSGYGDGRFGPSDTLTYEQAVAILVRAWGYEEDAVEAGGWPKGFLIVAEEIGLIANSEIVNSNAHRKTVALLVREMIGIAPNGAGIE